MSETRYNWLVDGQPAQNRYTILGDVTGSIEVSMEFESAVTTEILRTIPVTFIDMTAGRTLLGSVPGIDKDNLLTEILGFVPDKLFQFIERPGIQVPIELGTTSFLHADFGQVFKCEHGIRELNNMLRDTVIGISHKPSFSTGHPAEFPLGRSSAFGLKFGSEMGVVTTGILHSRRIKKCVVGTDCNVDNTPVNSEDGLFSSYLRGIGFELAMQVKRIIVLAKRQCRGLNLPRQVFPVIFRDTECNFDSAIRSRESCIPGIKKNTDNSGIVSHRRILFTERFELTFHSFQRLTCNISSSLHKRGWEIRNRLSNSLIGGIVAVHLTDRMGIESPLGTSIERHSIISHGFQERLPAIRRNVKFQLDCPNHNHILVLVGHILNGGDVDALLPTRTDGVSALL
jgi:hypothetical protein